jgi:hypothetical protein
MDPTSPRSIENEAATATPLTEAVAVMVGDVCPYETSMVFADTATASGPFTSGALAVVLSRDPVPASLIRSTGPPSAIEPSAVSGVGVLDAGWSNVDVSLPPHAAAAPEKNRLPDSTNPSREKRIDTWSRHGWSFLSGS